MGHRPEEAIAQYFPVTYKKKGSNFAVLVPDVPSYLSMKYKDHKVLAVKYYSSEVFIFIVVSTYLSVSSYNYRAIIFTLLAPFLAKSD